MLIAAGAFCALWRPGPEWIEQHFTNGYYPSWEHALAWFTPAFPFALGDAAAIVGIVLLIAIVVRAVVRSRAGAGWIAVARMLFGIAALLGAYAAWFYAGWGWGYDRAPVQTRVQYDAAQITPAALDALRAQAIAQMNRLAPMAHALHRGDNVDLSELRAAWTPVVQRLGDAWTPVANPPKITLAGWFMDRSGTSGFTNPLTLETQLAPDLLWFERPFLQAHEWSHVAGFNREDEANYVAVLACRRDSDVVAQYSGWFELFLALPPLRHYRRSLFAPEVWADFEALRARNARFVNLRVSQFSWRFYNGYLKRNHIAAGVRNYDQVTQLALAIPLDAQGLPLPR